MAPLEFSENCAVSQLLIFAGIHLQFDCSHGLKHLRRFQYGKEPRRQRRRLFWPDSAEGSRIELEPAQALYSATVFGQQILEARIVSQWVPNRVYLQTLHGHATWPA